MRESEVVSHVQVLNDTYTRNLAALAISHMRKWLDKDLSMEMCLSDTCP